MLAGGGYYLGAFFSGGIGIGIAIQWLIAYRIINFAQIRIAMVNVLGSPRQLTSYFLDGAATTLTLLPGQLFFRVQVATLGYLGLGPLGAFIYAKQMINIAAQLSGFTRRAELVRYGREGSSDRLHRLATYPSFVVAGVASFAVYILALTLPILPIHFPRDIRFVQSATLWMSPTVITSAAAGIVSMWYTMNHGLRLPALVMFFSNFVAIALMLMFQGTMVYWRLSLIEVLVHCVQIAVLWAALCFARKSRSVECQP
jgi:hypothetical protein